MKIVSIKSEERLYFFVIVGKDSLFVALLSLDPVQNIAESYKSSILSKHFFNFFKSRFYRKEVKSLSYCNKVIFLWFVQSHNILYLQIDFSLRIFFFEFLAFLLSSFDHILAEVNSFTILKMLSKHKEELTSTCSYIEVSIFIFDRFEVVVYEDWWIFWPKFVVVDSLGLEAENVHEFVWLLIYNK